jgi:hypothetical protein
MSTIYRRRAFLPLFGTSEPDDDEQVILLHLVIQLIVSAVALSLLALLGRFADQLSHPAVRRHPGKVRQRIH